MIASTTSTMRPLAILKSKRRTGVVTLAVKGAGDTTSANAPLRGSPDQSVHANRPPASALKRIGHGNTGFHPNNFVGASVRIAEREDK